MTHLMGIGQVLLDEQEALGYLRRFRSPKIERLAREAQFKKLLARCKLTRVCPHCGDPNGQIKCAPASSYERMQTGSKAPKQVASLALLILIIPELQFHV